jgi:hypothetical protein
MRTPTVNSLSLREETAVARPESREIAAVDDISGCCIGIRYSVGTLIDRLRGKLTEADRVELENIIRLTYDIQDYHEPIREQASTAYQSGREGVIADNEVVIL